MVLMPRKKILLYLSSEKHPFNNGMCDQCDIQCMKLKFRFRCPQCGKDFKRKK